LFAVAGKLLWLVGAFAIDAAAWSLGIWRPVEVDKSVVPILGDQSSGHWPS